MTWSVSSCDWPSVQVVSVECITVHFGLSLVSYTALGCTPYSYATDLSPAAIVH